jgi:hypothetical protein
MLSLLDCGTRPIESDLTPTPPGCTQPFHSDVEDGSVVCDDGAYDSLLVRQTQELNAFLAIFTTATSLHHLHRLMMNSVIRCPTETAKQKPTFLSFSTSLRRRASLPQSGFNRLWIRVFCLKCAAFPFTSLYTTTQTTGATSVWITPSLFWPCIKPRTLSFNTPISALATLDSSFHRICTQVLSLLRAPTPKQNAKNTKPCPPPLFHTTNTRKM